MPRHWLPSDQGHDLHVVGSETARVTVVIFGLGDPDHLFFFFPLFFQIVMLLYYFSRLNTLLS